MRVTLVCIGKIKEKFYKEAISEYLKRLSKYINLEIIELPDEKAPETLKPAEEEIVKINEGKRILKAVKGSVIIALAIEGQKMSSVQFSNFFSDNMVNGKSSFCFIIGGSLGLSREVLKTADYLISFSDMTFPHQLMRIIFLEQLYRANRIIKNEPYHK